MTDLVFGQKLSDSAREHANIAIASAPTTAIATALLIKMRAIVVAALACLGLIGCASKHQDIGQFRIVLANDLPSSFVCQPREEFYALDRSSRSADPTYLGTCGSPGFVVDQLHMPSDRSCFSISQDGASLMYLHRPELCGAGEKAKRKPGGVYVHSVRDGDRLLYPDTLVTQVWGGSDIGPGAIRVVWIGKIASRAGARAGQTLVLDAEGREIVEGQADSTLVR